MEQTSQYKWLGGNDDDACAARLKRGYEGKMRGYMKHRRNYIQVRADGGLGAPIRSAGLRPRIRVPRRLKNESFLGTSCTPGAESNGWTSLLFIRSTASLARRMMLVFVREAEANSRAMNVVQGEV